ncbi:hypothetical protein DXG03_001548 [Asterophora parasitica]|uniref:Uncharacterized protein n=1 Tax=Asterophora parasitica TaxID=117018 RepID=A0A9P7G9T2_9AGAR|nr:hypothetical protein DXG03_001548 [Asterophora parasitica]
MVSRSTKRAPANISSDNDDDEELNFLASQNSNGSEDHALELALAKHYAAVREKKRKENEQKFLKLKPCDTKVAGPAEDMKASIATIETIYADFLQKYAANEDTIHKLWNQIHKEQQRLLVCTTKKLALNEEACANMEKGHIAGLSRAKAASRELRGIIDQIYLLDD